MTREEFTKALATLLTEMCMEGERPILDYVLRSAEEQAALFKGKKSRCDGYEKKSQHQSGLAADIYFIDRHDPLTLGPPIKGWEYWHTIWQKKGGERIIGWDKGHFEMRQERYPVGSPIWDNA